MSRPVSVALCVPPGGTVGDANVSVGATHVAVVNRQLRETEMPATVPAKITS